MAIVESHHDRSYHDRVSSALVDRGLPPHAAQWVTRALHPPAESAGLHSVPDITTADTVRMGTRRTATFSGSSVPGSTPGAKWDMLIITVPGDSTGPAVFCGPAGIDFVEPGSSPMYYQCLRPLGITSSYNVGAIRIDQVGGGPAATLDFGVPILTSNDYDSFRHIYSSVTSYMTASELYNSGTVTAGQFDGRPVPSVGRYYNYGAGITTALTQAFDLPLDERSIVTRCAEARVAPAKEGVYMPHRMLGDYNYQTRPYAAGKLVTDAVLGPAVVGNTPLVSGTGYTYMLNSKRLAPSATNSVGFLPTFGFVGGASGHTRLSDAAVVDAFGMSNPPIWLPYSDTGYSRTNCSVTLYRGLDYEASITVKALLGIEVVVSPRSPLRDMQQPPEAPCPEALEVYYNIARSLPCCLPARDNSAGLLLGKIMELLPAVLPRVQRAVSAFLAPPPDPRPAPPRPRNPPAAPKAPAKKKRARRKAV